MKTFAVVVLVLLAVVIPCSYAIDFGPTYGMDYSGMDYNVTYWSSPSSMSANNWKASALLCQSYCLNDPKCCTWTYVNPDAGQGQERCCLKFGVPAELPNMAHEWTGASSRATTKECTRSGPPYPGPAWMKPAIHNTPDCLHVGGWHDIAGAMYWKGKYHVFQGCPGSGGWHHAVSTDLVHWDNKGITLKKSTEPYGDVPCSGFVTVDDDGNVCAGYRLCSGNWPNKPTNDVPLELRCALDDDLTQWGPPEYIYWFQFNRALPYDPVRPWKDTDGQWYSTIAADGCNGTDVPCSAGGREYLYTSPRLRGNGSNWKMLGPMWTSNYTVLTPYTGATLDRELVTVDYIGNLIGDPLQGKTRILFNNVCGNGCCACTTGYYMGTQQVGGAFTVPNSGVGMVDWGAFKPNGKGKRVAGLSSTGDGGWMFEMARTLSADPNQVTGDGRKTMVAWIGGGSAALQSLPRDLTLDPRTGALLQDFAPELRSLRTTRHTDVSTISSQQFELSATFTVKGTNSTFGFQVLVGTSANDFISIGIDLNAQQVFVGDRAGPLQSLPTEEELAGVYTVHAYIDHQIVTVIVNRQTALTVFHSPASSASNAVKLFGVDGNAVSVSVTAFDLKSI